MAIHKKYPALGRGLDVLLPTNEVEARGSSSISEIELDNIFPNPDQPRKEMDPVAMREPK